MEASEAHVPHILAPHPVQGWDLLCNGVIAFDDGGALLPDGGVVAARRDVVSALDRAVEQGQDSSALVERAHSMTVDMPLWTYRLA